MGNRAVIAFGKSKDAFGIYLHWNGGSDSVRAFLDATRELMKSRGPDEQYGPARLVQVIGNWFGGSLSVGLGTVRSMDTDNGDNGTYYVDPETLQIIGRAHNRTGCEQFDPAKYAGVYAECLAKNRHIFNPPPEAMAA